MQRKNEQSLKSSLSSRYWIPSLCLATAIGFSGFSSSSVSTGNWPQFRGPHASGVDDSELLVTNWNTETGENIRWQTPIPGLAHASPIVWGDRVYVATAVKPGKASLKVGLYGDIEPLEENETNQWRLLAIDKSTGKVAWDTQGYEGVPRGKRHPKSTYCNSTPATDGSRIVAIFGSEGLFCFDKTGKLIWKKDLGPMESGYYVMSSAQWGFASSPVIHEGKVVVLCDLLTNSFLAVFNLTDGKEVWRTPRNDVPTWGTPTVVEAAKGTQIVVNGWHASGGYDFTTGKNLWTLNGGGDIPVPTPIFARELIYLTSAHGNSSPMRAIRADASGDITPGDPGQTNATIVWANPNRGDYMQTPIVVGELLFGCADIGTVTCFDATTGAFKYRRRLAPFGQGFTASAVSDGRNLYYTSELGNVFVVPVTNKFSVVATNELHETCMATPAISQGTLFFRTREKLVAIGAKR